MPAPFSLDDVLGLPDVLSTDRHSLIFPSIPGALGFDVSKSLTIREMSVSFPAIRLAQVRVQMYGFSSSFRGLADQDNTFQVSFYEDTGGNTLDTLLSWLNVCHNRLTGESGRKTTYAAQAEFHAFDTTGRSAYIFNLVNIWPVSIEIPQADSTSTQHAMVSTTFAVDFIDLTWAAKTQPRLVRETPQTGQQGSFNENPTTLPSASEYGLASNSGVSNTNASSAVASSLQQILGKSASSLSTTDLQRILKQLG